MEGASGGICSKMWREGMEGASGGICSKTWREGGKFSIYLTPVRQLLRRNLILMPAKKVPHLITHNLMAD
jgi:hypothetical protein